MREDMGLFRGKRLDNKEWVEGNLLTYRVLPVIFNTREREQYECDGATVGEFTGRVFGDKKAFAGDIFHIPDEECDVMIVWDEYASAFMAVSTQDGGTIWLSDYADDDMFWIGTKWDNPELLEATQ